MDSNEKVSIWKNVTAHRWVVVLLIVAVFGAYIYKFGNPELSVNQSEWGTFGDFIGGLLNPLVAFAALWWLTESVNIQRTELSETRKALEESSEAQKQQVQIGELNSQLTLLKARLDIVNNTIHSETAYRNALVDKWSWGEEKQGILDREGSKSFVGVELGKSSNLIKEQTGLRDNLLVQIESAISNYSGPK